MGTPKNPYPMCEICKKPLTAENCPLSRLKRGRGRCTKCHREYQQKLYGFEPDQIQEPGKEHTFRCGCTGVLPDKRGESNKFANFSHGVWRCRISTILNASQAAARLGHFLPMDLNTPHHIIRVMMDTAICELCKQPLIWEFGKNKTPHLHHNHTTGKIYGFAHFKCNTRALEIEVEFLREFIKDSGLTLPERGCFSSNCHSSKGQE